MIKKRKKVGVVPIGKNPDSAKGSKPSPLLQATPTNNIGKESI